MALEGRLQEALAFEAPYVIDRLVRDRVVATRASAEQLFNEAKKYLVLSAATPDKSFDMSSAMVDEAWHAFVLFTAEYTDFSQRYFGSYVHHAPAGERGGPETTILDGGSQEMASFDDFCRRYEVLFGQPLPRIWYDSDNVTPSTRVINDMAQTLTIAAEDHTVHVVDGTGNTVLSVDEMAIEAVEFIVNMHAFYVRELPGDLTAAEKVGLIQPLIRLGVLRLAP
ncbi:hypothetical protein A5790_05910 [Mycobacterium sp. 852002-51152_SCH6134967]|uniref:glycine-rich domain-containing protein n=1 Tax=Mycobacterium sp. 852002-51152_SCH6134967 TaxID=1834096 RepID=UPI0007FF679B|nr:hypothetical protein [Mycobacterium sp. 852002-51152_SCH6134967]OBF96218.1 hypothetical protein A5790_05910 [Mycobacterium sp. 852002-51152_SCH6134967]